MEFPDDVWDLFGDASAKAMDATDDSFMPTSAPATTPASARAPSGSTWQTVPSCVSARAYSACNAALRHGESVTRRFYSFFDPFRSSQITLWIPKAASASCRASSGLSGPVLRRGEIFTAITNPQLWLDWFDKQALMRFIYTAAPRNCFSSSCSALSSLWWLAF